MILRLTKRRRPGTNNMRAPLPLLLLLLLGFSECQRPTMPQFSPTGAPAGASAGSGMGKSIAELLADETTVPSSALISTTHAATFNSTEDSDSLTTVTPPPTTTTPTIASTTAVQDEENEEKSPGSVFVTGFISTKREEYQQDAAMSRPVSRGGGVALLFDPTGGDEGVLSREGPMDADGHSYHVPAKCHTYVPDHLAGDDDYRKL